MNKRSTAQLYGKLRLVPDVDTIGIPVFTPSKQGNALFIPETDADLRITRFLDFHWEGDYKIEAVNEANVRREYAIGDPVPIPFWVAGKAYITPGNSTVADISRLVGSNFLMSVASDLGDILTKARSGEYRLQEETRQADDIASRFDDVLGGRPVHSKYWISRYRVALANARSFSHPPHPIDARLKATACAWLKVFGSKTSIRKLKGILGSPDDGILSEVEARDIIFAYCCSKLVGRNWVELFETSKESDFQKYFPNGLHHHYVANGFPVVPFDYNRPDDFEGVFKEALFQAARESSYLPALRIARVLFGRGELPTDLGFDVGKLFSGHALKFRQMLEFADANIFHQRDRKDEWAKTASDLINEYYAVHYLEAMIYGDTRFLDKPLKAKFGYDPDLLNDLKRYINE
jgi:hypothetical protein